MTAAVEVSGLRVASAARVLVRPCSLELRAGEILVVLGETGSGKSLLAQAIMGTLPPELACAGRIVLGGEEVGHLPPAARRRLWGRRIALLPQEPWSALNPTMAAGGQVAEVHALLHGRPWAEARRRAASALAALGLGRAVGRHPFRLSGGMAQRVAIAATAATGAPVLLADEPTKGLDAGLRDEVAALLAAEAAGGAAVMVITHDVGLARRLGGRVAVMLDGEVVETGPAGEVIAAPRHAYTRLLLAADPETWAPAGAPAGARAAGATVLSARGLAKALGGRTLFSGLDLEVGAGGIVAVAGPSGCGKTTLGNVLLGLLAPDAGTVSRRPGTAAHRYQKIYQDPVAAFAPQATLRAALGDVVARHGLSWDAAARLLSAMRVPDGLLDRRPAQVSGGELQRVALARALLVDPVFLFADEATSRLDPLTQKQVMDLLNETVAERRLAVLMVTHDPALARGMASRTVRLEMPSPRDALYFGPGPGDSG
ncbi:ABC transporter ATP-binding protein [Arenibaculum sp.]|uniref:ABC transporter ATP-binding protein n=1 Tax=Arenibaculum sp. TaxID=2865862 RepID=UPI002E124A00|nr:ATP-binding cassette domain-containing protein [Arenibaculum sp.]